MKLVVIAGPNDPEVIDSETPEGRKDAAAILVEFAWEDITVYARTEEGLLHELERSRVEQVSSDDQFCYMRTTWLWWPDPRGTREFVAFDWDIPRGGW